MHIYIYIYIYVYIYIYMSSCMHTYIHIFICNHKRNMYIHINAYIWKWICGVTSHLLHSHRYLRVSTYSWYHKYTYVYKYSCSRILRVFPLSSLYMLESVCDCTPSSTYACDSWHVLNVFICMCVCVYIYIYACMCIYMYKYIHIYREEKKERERGSVGELDK